MANDITGFRNRTVPADLAAPFNAPPKAQDTGPGIDRALQIPLPEIYPIPGATEFNPIVQKATAIVEANIATGLSVVVPNNNLGIIRGVVIYIANMLTTTNVTYTVMINGAPASGYNNLSMFPRVSPYVSNTFDAFIRVPQGATITVVYSNIDGGTYTIGAALSGWWWPQSLGDLWKKNGSL